MNTITPGSIYYNHVLKQLYWKLDAKTPNKEEYEELKVLLNFILNVKDDDYFIGLCSLAERNKLFRAIDFIHLYLFQHLSGYMAVIGDTAPRILWLEHYISNYENRSLWYKIKSFFKS